MLRTFSKLRPTRDGVVRELCLDRASSHFALVVASNEQVRTELADALVSRGYAVHTCTTAESAAGLLLQVSFSVIVVGPQPMALAGPAVRALLRQHGTPSALVFFDPALGGDIEGIPPDVICEVEADESLAAKLRQRMPCATTLRAKR